MTPVAWKTSAVHQRQAVDRADSGKGYEGRSEDRGHGISPAP